MLHTANEACCPLFCAWRANAQVVKLDWDTAPRTSVCNQPQSAANYLLCLCPAISMSTARPRLSRPALPNLCCLHL